MIVGIDIGTRGALALLTLQGHLIEVADMPVLQDGPKGRRTLNAPLLAGLIYRWHVQQAYVETVGARPGEGAVGAFSFGRARGVIEGVLAACDVPCNFITAPSWKRLVGIPLATKDVARSEAIRRFPSHAAMFRRKLDDGRAEAVLIALAGLKRAASLPHDNKPVLMPIA